MNLVKGQKRFACISNLIAIEGADSVVGGRIYVAAVLAVLLYGSESWVWTSSMLNTIRGFHHCACRWLTDKKPIRRQNGTYWYCPADEAMEEKKKGSSLRHEETNLQTMQEGNTECRNSNQD